MIRHGLKVGKTRARLVTKLLRVSSHRRDSLHRAVGSGEGQKRTDLRQKRGRGRRWTEGDLACVSSVSPRALEGQR